MPDSASPFRGCAAWRLAGAGPVYGGGAIVTGGLVTAGGFAVAGGWEHMRVGPVVAPTPGGATAGLAIAF